MIKLKSNHNKYLIGYLNLYMLVGIVILSSCGINKFDKEGNRHGKWRNYWDDEHIQAKGRYKNGWQKGTWMYYNKEGQLSQKQVHHKDKTIDITYFHPNGVIESYGKAKIQMDEKGSMHYFWYDRWLFYDDQGSLKTEKYFLEGQAMEGEEFTK